MLQAPVGARTSAAANADTSAAEGILAVLGRASETAVASVAQQMRVPSPAVTDAAGVCRPFKRQSKAT